METKSKTPEPQVRLCRTCSLPVPEHKKKTALYCSIRCKDRARKRKARGNPTSDAHFHLHKSGSEQEQVEMHTAKSGTSASLGRTQKVEAEPRATSTFEQKVEVETGHGKSGTSTFTSPASYTRLTDQITRLETHTRKLAQNNRRLTKKNKALHLQLDNARSALATAQDQARKTKIQAIDNVRELLDEQAEKITDLENLLFYHQPRSELFDEAKEDVEWADQYLAKSLISFKKDVTRLQQSKVLLEQALGASSALIFDYVYFAKLYFKTVGARGLSSSDSERLVRLKNFLVSGGAQEVERLRLQRQKEAWHAAKNKHIPRRPNKK